MQEEALEAGSKTETAIAVLGTFDSKGEEHRFLAEAIARRGFRPLTINVGTKGPATTPADIDLRPQGFTDRDQAIAATIEQARKVLAELYAKGEIGAVISAGGGSGTHLCTSVMKVLPMGAPKVMVSTVAAHDMAEVVGTKDITMIHSIGDLLGVNSLVGVILDRAAGAVCGMSGPAWQAPAAGPRVGLSMFGFITTAAENIKSRLEAKGFEVIAFHANGTGGLAMEELAAEGRFDAIMDLATHELADTLKDGYCKLIGPGRLEPRAGHPVPRLVVPGGLDCAVLEFTRDTVPEEYQGRKIFYYDFRSAVRLSLDETRTIAEELADKLNRSQDPLKVLIPTVAFSEADGPGAPLDDPALNAEFVEHFTGLLDPAIEVKQAEMHINDPAFAEMAVDLLAGMLGR